MYSSFHKLLTVFIGKHGFAPTSNLLPRYVSCMTTFGAFPIRFPVTNLVSEFPLIFFYQIYHNQHPDRCSVIHTAIQ